MRNVWISKLKVGYALRESIVIMFHFDGTSSVLVSLSLTNFVMVEIQFKDYGMLP